MVRNLAHILYHVAVVVLSAAAALSLPAAVRFVARNYLAYWSLIENEKVFLVGVEIAVAVFLILLVNSALRSLRDRRFAGMARGIGLHSVCRPASLLAGKRVRGLKRRQSFGRDQKIGSLYLPLLEYFLARWSDPALPEYDFEADELVFRDKAGNIVGRERYGGREPEAVPAAAGV